MQKNIILIVQIILSILLVASILIQAKGTGLSSSIMGGSSIYSTKRGVEKIVYRFTILISLLFFASSILLLVIK